MPAKAKQQTHKQVREGKHYQCAECNAWCDDTIQIVGKESNKMYMGRMSAEAPVVSCTHYCSMACGDKAYKTTLHGECTGLLAKLGRMEDQLALNPTCELYLKLDKEMQQEWKAVMKVGVPLVMMKAFRSTGKLYKMILGNASSLQLIEQRFKTKKFIGEALEEFHYDENATDLLCNLNYQIDGMKLQRL